VSPWFYLTPGNFQLRSRYGAVVRGQGAYVPPGARRGPAGALSPPSSTANVVPLPATTVKPEIPKVAVNGPDGSAVSQTDTPPDKTPSPSPVPAKVCWYNIVLWIVLILIAYNLGCPCCIP
jgi:hypothetical protein